MVKRLNGLERLEWEQQREKENIASLVHCLFNDRSIPLTESLKAQSLCSIPITAPTKSTASFPLQASETLKAISSFSRQLIMLTPESISEGHLAVKNKTKTTLSQMTLSRCTQDRPIHKL